jgi:LAO/AO transport system kinase
MELHERIIQGEVRAAARLLRWIDDADPRAEVQIRALYPHTRGAFVLGVTGNPGSGKSTLVNGLIRRYASEGLKVGVLAVDPSSPFTGGAILGDRIRMQEHAANPHVFIRSLATRGYLGGLSKATYDSLFVLDAWGAEVVIVETVGVGQDEVDVMNCADTSVVVVVPGLGDEVQAIKAGVLEIADVFVVNKADRDGADKVVAELKAMQELVRGSLARTPTIVKTAAARDQGLDELVQAIEEHRRWLADSGEGRRRKARFLHQTVFRHVQQRLEKVVQDRLERSQELKGAVERLVDRSVDPFSLADSIWKTLPEA